MIYTVCISRGLSKTPGRAGVFPLGKIIQLLPGDRVDEFHAEKEPEEGEPQPEENQADIFFFKVIDIEPETAKLINQHIYGGDDVELNTISPQDRAVLMSRGKVAPNIGGPLDLSDIVNNTKSDNYENLTQP